MKTGVRAARVNRKGMSMVTAVIAMIILSLAMLGVADVFLRSLKNNGTAAGVTGLSQLAGRVTEMVMLLPPKSALLVNGTNINPATNLGMGADQYDTNLYVAQAAVADTTISTHDGSQTLVRVTVTAKYKEAYAKTMGVDPNVAGVNIVTYRYRVN